MAEETSGTTTPGAQPTAPRTRRRAAARPAGPPVVESAAPAPAAASEAKPAKAAKAAKASKAAQPSKAAKSAPAAKGASQEPAGTPPADAVDAAPAARRSRGKAASAQTADSSSAAPATPAAAVLTPIFQAPDATAAPKRTRGAKPAAAAAEASEAPSANSGGASADADSVDGNADGGPRRRRRGGRGRGSKAKQGAADGAAESTEDSAAESDEDSDAGEESGNGSSKRRRRRRRAGAGDGDGEPGGESGDDVATVVHVRQKREPSARTAGGGSVRLEARKQRRREGREGTRRRTVITEAEFLARRESVDRVMAVRDRDGITQIGVLEDGILVEHYVTQAGSTSLIGNVYLGKVQNVLPSMEAAFVDIGRGRNGVLYAGEVNWDLLGVSNGADRRIENVLKSGDTVLVQVSKDPVGQKGARLTAMVSLPGRYIVYVPNSATTGISRKLPESERNRLKTVLRAALPEDGGVIVRTAAEGASEEDLSRDVTRLLAQWQDIQTKSQSSSAPALLYAEPDMTIKVVRDIFNEDVKSLKVQGLDAYDMLEQYIGWVAPDLLPRLEKWVDKEDIFASFRVEEQLAKALDRKVYLPSGGSLVIDRTEAMTVVDVNTGRFIGSGGNLEETVTKNNLEAAEEIVRQLRLRDIGGIIVIDFIDMVLESNREQVLRRLIECLGRDRTKHQVAEVTSLGLVQMTRKRLSQGLLEVFSTPCDSCGGRGIHVNSHPAPVKEDKHEPGRERSSRSDTDGHGPRGKGKSSRSGSKSTAKGKSTAKDSAVASQ